MVRLWALKIERQRLRIFHGRRIVPRLFLLRPCLLILLSSLRLNILGMPGTLLQLRLLCHMAELLGSGQMLLLAGVHSHRVLCLRGLRLRCLILLLILLLLRPPRLIDLLGVVTVEPTRQ